MLNPSKLYLMRCRLPNGKNVWKFGITDRHPKQRLAEIKANGGSQKDTVLFTYTPANRALKAEKSILNHYRRLGCKYKGFSGSGSSEWVACWFPFYGYFRIWLEWAEIWFLRIFAAAVILCALMGIYYNLY